MTAINTYRPVATAINPAWKCAFHAQLNLLRVKKEYLHAFIAGRHVISRN